MNNWPAGQPIWATVLRRKAIFRAPLTQGDFSQYFQNSMIVTVVSLFFILLFGAMAAFALAEFWFKGNILVGLCMAIGIMIPIRLGTVSIQTLMVAGDDTLMTVRVTGQQDCDIDKEIGLSFSDGDGFRFDAQGQRLR